MINIFKLCLPIFLLIFFINSCEKQNAPPSCEISSPQDGAEYQVGDLVSISAEAEDEDGRIAEVSFFINDIGSGSAIDLPYSYLWNTSNEDIGIQIIKIMVKDDKGDVAEDEISILLNPGGEAPVAAFTVDTTSIPEGDSIQFTDQSTNEPTIWSWDFGDGGTSTMQNPSHTYTLAGTYTVVLVATNIIGSNTETKTNYIIVTTTGTVTDYDGNTYNTLKIGDQWWMQENLKVTHYADGEAIPLVEDKDSWTVLDFDAEAMCYYDNSSSYSSTYGALYSWGSAMNGASSSSSNPSEVQGVCPSGWHLPSDDEWIQLEIHLGIDPDYVGYVGARGTNEGSKLAGNSELWTNGNLKLNEAFGTTGFMALPGGLRDYSGRYQRLGEHAHFWSATVDHLTYVLYRELYYSHPAVLRYTSPLVSAYSVRCVKDSQ